MTDIAVPRPAITTVAGVELMKTGTWHTSTGWFTFTADDLRSAVAAQDDPAVRTPIIKLGHSKAQALLGGMPTIGRVINLRTENEGNTLVGDLEGVPAWIAELMPTAWPSRSIEGEYGYVTAKGTEHPFVLTGLALLGVESPAIETLEDIASLYGVAAAAASHVGHPLTIDMKEGAMPQRVAATVSTEDIRRAYYDGPGSGWAWWICELQIDPPQLIVENDDDGDLYRVPYSIAGNEVTFEDPVEVNVTYVDASTPRVAASAARWATRAESRPDTPDRRPAAATAPPGQEGASPVADLTQLRQALDLPDDATDEQVLEAALDKATAPVVEPVVDPPAVVAPVILPEGVTTIDESTLADLVAAAGAGKAAHETLRRQDRDRFLDEAVQAGKFAPARKPHFAALFDADEEGTRQVVASLAAGTIPLVEVGHQGQPDMSDYEADYQAHYGTPATKEA